MVGGEAVEGGEGHAALQVETAVAPQQALLLVDQQRPLHQRRRAPRARVRIRRCCGKGSTVRVVRGTVP